jgi:hypothetical protein
MAIEDHWRNISSRGCYLFEQYYTPNGDRLIAKEFGEINQVLIDALQKHGNLTTILFAFLDENKHHHIHAKSLKLAYKRYGHLFVPEFIELAKHQQKERKSKINIFE